MIRRLLLGLAVFAAVGGAGYAVSALTAKPAAACIGGNC